MGRTTLFPTRRWSAALMATTGLVLGLALVGPGAGAQTATVPTTAATPVTTAVGTVTTLPVPTTASATTTTTEADLPPEPLIATNSSSSSTPWLAIGLIVVGVLILVVLLVMALRRRGGGDADGSSQRGSTRNRGHGGRDGAARAAWRERAAKATAEAGACVRQVATGGAVTGAVVSQLVTSIRGYAEMAGVAPDDDTRLLIERARRALQGLGQQIDADHQLRRAQPPADPARLAASAQSVAEAAGETDRVLRAVYRELNEPD